MNHPRAARAPSPPARPPEDQARVDYYRAQFPELGEADLAEMATPVSPEEQAAGDAWLHGEGPWPFGR